jgi:hypothetical protein
MWIVEADVFQPSKNASGLRLQCKFNNLASTKYLAGYKNTWQVFLLVHNNSSQKTDGDKYDILTTTGKDIFTIKILAFTYQNEGHGCKTASETNDAHNK